MSFFRNLDDRTNDGHHLFFCQLSLFLSSSPLTHHVRVLRRHDEGVDAQPPVGEAHRGADGREARAGVADGGRRRGFGRRSIGHRAWRRSC